MIQRQVTLDGYVVSSVTNLAIGIRKRMQPHAPLVWLPRSHCQDGDELEIGAEDIECAEWLAEREGLDW